MQIRNIRTTFLSTKTLFTARGKNEREMDISMTRAGKNRIEQINKAQNEKKRLNYCHELLMSVGTRSLSFIYKYFYQHKLNDERTWLK